MGKTSKIQPTLIHWTRLPGNTGGLPGLQGWSEFGEYEVGLLRGNDPFRQWYWRVFTASLGWQSDSSVYHDREQAVAAAEADCVQRQTNQREIDAANWQLLTTETVTPPAEKDPPTWGTRQRQNFNELVGVLTGEG